MKTLAGIDMDRMYEEHAKPVYRYLLGQCGNPNDAEDLTAETFYRAVKSVDSYNGKCKFQTWLFQIAKHVWYQEIAKRKHQPISIEAADSISSGESTEDNFLADEGKVAFYRNMQKLNDSTREVMYLRLSGELSFREIGEILGKTENWARVTFYRGKERMRTDEQK